MPESMQCINNQPVEYQVNMVNKATKQLYLQ